MSTTPTSQSVADALRERMAFSAEPKMPAHLRDAQQASLWQHARMAEIERTALLLDQLIAVVRAAEVVASLERDESAFAKNYSRRDVQGSYPKEFSLREALASLRAVLCGGGE